MAYTVIKFHEFDSNCSRYRIPVERIDSLIDALKENPYQGNPLGYKFLREKRYEGKRIYFTIYEKYKIVLLISASDKKSQERTIQELRRLLPYFKKLAEEFSGL